MAIQMKRFRSKVKGETDSINMAEVLMLISQSGEETSDKRMFKCKTCNRQFPSFQALGGHRASHKRSRTANDNLQGQTQSVLANDNKPRVHECSICGVGFATGQALGGHMRRHRPTIDSSTSGFDHVLMEKKSNGKRMLLLDLNLPALGDDTERRELGLRLELGLGFHFVDKTPMVNCFH